MGRRSKTDVPQMRKDKSRNRAYVRIDTKRHWLGAWGTNSAQVKYDALVAGWLASGRTDTDTAKEVIHQETKPEKVEPVSGKLTLADVVAAWMEDIVANQGGDTSGLYYCSRSVGRALSEFLATPVEDFGPKRFKLVMRNYAKLPITDRKKVDGEITFVQRPRSRRYVNDTMKRIRQMLRWAKDEEMIDASIPYRLESIPLLNHQCQYTTATEPRKPITKEQLTPTLAKLTEEMAALVECIYLAGCRPGEMCSLTMEQVHDMDKPVWRYVPKRHKNAWRGQIRHIAIGPQAQKIINAQIKRYNIKPSEPVFSGRRSVPRSRPNSKPCSNSKLFFTSQSVRIAVARACVAAEVKHWFPYLCRYAAAKKAGLHGGIQTVMATIGDSQKMAEHYAPQGFELAAKFAEVEG